MSASSSGFVPPRAPIDSATAPAPATPSPTAGIRSAPGESPRKRPALPPFLSIYLTATHVNDEPWPAHRRLPRHQHPDLRESALLVDAELAPAHTSVVWSTSSTTSGSGPASTSMARRTSRTRSGCRYSTSSACISQRLRPVASSRNRSAEPKQATAEPRSIGELPRHLSEPRRDGCSCSMEVGSHTFQAVSVAPSQNSNRPS